MNDIGIIGAGAWGAALAQILAQKGHRVMMWARRDFVVERANEARASTALPGITLHEGITATGTMAMLDDCPVLLYVLPAQHLRDFLRTHPPRRDQTLVLAAKGIEMTTGALLTQVVAETNPGLMTAVLTGPNFAREVAQGLPAAATLACTDETMRHELVRSLSTKTYRLYPTHDIVGAQVGGAIKNVIAIACGIVDGLKLGDNARAAVVTRGLAEMARLTVALGGGRETLMGLCGMGDLILCCTSAQSRNYRCGLALADGEPHHLRDDSTVEGVHTASAILPLLGRLDIEMPIAVAVAACLNGQLSVEQAVEALLQRPTRDREDV
jgi:glycerol-3-phosphate dehydrogenase (NAD(P)+)